jgi:hypothetical protein
MASCNFQVKDDSLRITEILCNLKNDHGKCDQEKCIIWIILDWVIKR